MNKGARKVLELFQCDHVRQSEETFAQTLSESEEVRLFFINENAAFTDGRNIVVDPATDELFCDKQALEKTTAFLNWPSTILSDMWNALGIITRAQTIHECLHVLYTDFPSKASTDPKYDTKLKKKIIGNISNIIEDAYIEAVGCSIFDNMEFYLRFGRVARLFAANPSEGTAERLMKEEKHQAVKIPEVRKKLNAILEFLNYMAILVLFPMLDPGKPSKDIAPYVDQTKQLFLDGCMAPSPDERHQYSDRIYDILLPLIPDVKEDVDLEDDQLEKLLGGTKTHSPESETISNEQRKGRTQAVTVRLFVNPDGSPREEGGQSLQQLLSALKKLADEKKVALNIVLYEGHSSVHQGMDYDCSILHKGIAINENHPKINLQLRRAYQNIYNKYRININSYNSRFVQLLRAHVPVQEEKYQFGTAIVSKRLGDPQKRYWSRKVHEIDVPDMAVLLLIDGSGSMSGPRRDAAIVSSVVLHEVLKYQGIQHSIVEHRATSDKPEIDVNILVGFNGREEEKLNILQIEADGNSRDALALSWAERYIDRNCHADEKLIIVISDGEPCHNYDQYYPPVSCADTAEEVKKIIHRGTKVIAISLDAAGSYECYDQLKAIYPNLVGCNDISRLTGQLLGVIAKLL